LSGGKKNKTMLRTSREVWACQSWPC